jgi:hypothetical protein
LKIPATKLASLTSGEENLATLCKYLPELTNIDQLNSFEATDIWKYKFPMWGQTTTGFKHGELLVLMQTGPASTITSHEEIRVQWVLALPAQALEPLIDHIEKCLVYRRQNKGVPWNLSISRNNEIIVLSRSGGLGLTECSSHFGYVIRNETRKHELKMPDIIMIKRGFLDFLREIRDDLNKT